MSDALPLVDVINRFDHADGSHPLASLRTRLAGVRLRSTARAAPREGDLFVLKPRYSGFDHTPLAILLRRAEGGAAPARGNGDRRLHRADGDRRPPCPGFKVTILTDACATNDERLERIALEYAEEVVGARLGRSADA